MIKSCINFLDLTHDGNGDNMNRYDLWLLFVKTGKIEYYLKYKNDKGSNIEDDQEGRGNYS